MIEDKDATLTLLLEMARTAGDAILDVYARGALGVEYKGANDPVTVADRRANDLLCEALTRAFPGIPIVAEESDPATFAGWQAAPRVWFVDPLDGTREFIDHNGEFAVMIGLAEGGRATMGVVSCPALGRDFVGAEGFGAFEVTREGARKALSVSKTAQLADAELVVSRFHRAARLESAAARHGVRTITPCGSAGVKAVRVATGEADVYAQAGRAGKRWDSCAPEAIVRAAGGKVSDAFGKPIEYASGALDNQDGLIATNAPLFPQVLELMRSGAAPK